ncbi:MAG: glutamate-5-semialdehyde dehydrogenase [Gammaproteobacteria bacterium]|tara:strand:- start:475 stop:1731 length:1257 start_codon:yes stop_codon:yes gene_type:complete
MNIKDYVSTICINAQNSSKEISCLREKAKNSILNSLIEEINLNRDLIKSSNTIDIENFKSSDNYGDAFLDRLLLDDNRIDGMVASIKEIIEFKDPVGQIKGLEKMKSGIKVGKMSMPLGVIAMIYESRPNVTIDASALSIKSGNAIILRGGSESINTNIALGKCIKNSLIKNKVNKNIVQLIDNTDRDIVNELLLQNNYIDIVIPRGGKNLIKLIDEISSISVLRHLDGICHVYLDKDCDFDKALNIAINSKTQRTGVCNAMETLIIHNDISEKFLPLLHKELLEKNVEIRGCKKTQSILSSIALATEDDWKTEYLDSILSIIIVSSMNDAIKHISKYGSGHTDVIVTENKENAETFLRNVDSSSVMHNASSRFADGYEYGLGAEIGISTNKLHARGPVGIEGLTNEKFIVLGDGNVR